jgi:pimeloyl-ACP methyl ester carboxylesterase
MGFLEDSMPSAAEVTAKPYAYDFPVGYRFFHPVDVINYQINRWLPTAEPTEFLPATQNATLPEWEERLLRLGDKARTEGRALNAATYYRGAEFFMSFDNPRKIEAYDNYRDQIMRVDVGLPYERTEIPYLDGRMPAFHFKPLGARRDTLVVHGGFDSYVEEFLFWGAEYAAHGFEVILFEGPGQGASLRKFGLKMDPDWHKPLGAVLDHFQVAECTLLGLSLGGCLGPRAAAFEPRVKRLIALNILYDFFDCFSPRLGTDAGVALSRRLASGDEAGLERAWQQIQMGNPGLAWACAHGQHISGSASFGDYLRWLKRMTTADISHRLTQDVLLLAGTEDHIVPLRQFHQQAEALTNVRSLTTRLFTAAEEAQAHCQVGALRLVLDYMRSWMDFQLTQLGR